MKPINVNETTLVKATLFGDKIVHVSDDRIQLDSLPEGWYRYETRHGDENDWATPVTIEHHVLVNWCNTIISQEAIVPETDKFIEIDEDDLLIEYDKSYKFEELL